MTYKAGNEIVIEPEPDRECEPCGVTAECRPYGPKGEQICYDCSMKDKAGTEQRFLELMNLPGLVAVDRN